MHKVIILGAGASGIMSAILVAQKIGGDKVLVIEGSDRAMKKLSLSGNGQCNLTNQNINANRYYGDTNFIQTALSKFSIEDTLKLFNSLGILTIADSQGRIYPRSRQASSVTDLLRFHAEKLGIEIAFSEMVTKITKKGETFEVTTNTSKHSSTYLIYALGGASYPKLLTKDTNFNLITTLGHTTNKLLPALVQLKSNSNSIKMLKGIKAPCKLSIMSYDKVLSSVVDEIHFADGAISGPATFLMSPVASRLLGDNAPCKASIDFFPEISSGELMEILSDRIDSISHLKMEYFFSTIVHNQIGRAILKRSDVSINEIVGSVTDENLERILKNAKNFQIDINGTYGFNFAQVSLGGVKTSEVKDNMESKIVSNLFVLGEALDVTGDCGGFNLQWAWTTAKIVSENF